MVVNNSFIKAFFTFFCCILTTSIYSQILQGRIVDVETGRNLVGASIFINNTSIGTSSDSSGSFRILNPLDGDLIVSFIGYETLAMPINTKKIDGKKFLLKLEKKQENLEDVMIINEATRAKYLDYFKKVFLGNTDAAYSCKIENLKDVYFVRPDDDKDAIGARSDNPLVIINKKLGYKITFDIVDFYYNTKTLISSYYGYTMFEDLGDKKKYRKQRELSYYGSSLHFFRALLADSLKENDFEVRNNITDSTMKIDGRFVKKSYRFDVHNALNIDTASGLQSLKWIEELMVRYSKGANVQPSPRNSTIIIKRNPSSVLTKLSDVIWIDKYGIVINPMHLYTSGYWANYKVANMLPYNYYPKQ